MINIHVPFFNSISPLRKSHSASWGTSVLCGWSMNQCALPQIWLPRSALPCFTQNIEPLYIFFALCCKAQYVMEWFLSGTERAGWSIMCNLATISTGARVTKYQGGCLSNLSLSPPSHNDNSKSLTGLVLHFHNGGKRGTPFLTKSSFCFLTEHQLKSRAGTF